MDSLITDASNITTIRLPKQYDWEPQKDITAFELAKCLPVLIHESWYGIEMLIDKLPENAARHFAEV